MAWEVEVLCPRRTSNGLLHLAGLAILGANSVRHRVRGYRTPRPQPVTSADDAFRYDFAVVSNWLEHLRRHLQRDPQLVGRHALEIGPGPDLGTGLLLLAMGATSYTAIDVNPLLTRAPAGLHDGLAERIAARTGGSAAELSAQFRALQAGRPDRLRYEARGGLDLSIFPPGCFDLVLSHAVLEHLQDVGGTCVQLARVCRPKALFAAEIDLQTHSRWIRDADPLNIYRYPDPLYAAMRFAGSPNRLRPSDYEKLLAAHGWSEVHLYPRRVLDPSYVGRVEPTLAARFRGDLERLGWLSVVACATFEGD